MNSKTIYKPAAFFLITMLISWGFTLVAIYFSHQQGMKGPAFLLFLAAACGPFATALIMHYRAKSPELWRDYWDRLVNLKRINLATAPIMLLLAPFVMVVSILLSLLFGKSAAQFTLTPQGSFSMGVPVMFIMILIPTLEEMGWKGYGVDSLRSRFNLFYTSLWFGALWSLWHAPMFFIKNTYMNGLLSNGVYTANYFVSIFALAFIINWLFYKNNRSIIACALFHIIVDISAEIFAVEQFTKCIDTAVLILVAALLVLVDRKLFFEEKAPV
jgi:membrane protease YdiL (CAAX protease family)